MVGRGASGIFASLDHLHLCFAGLFVLTASTTSTLGHLLEGIIMGLGRSVGAMGIVSLKVEGWGEAIFREVLIILVLLTLHPLHVFDVVSLHISAHLV